MSARDPEQTQRGARAGSLIRRCGTDLPAVALEREFLRALGSSFGLSADEPHGPLTAGTLGRFA